MPNGSLHLTLTVGRASVLAARCKQNYEGDKGEYFLHSSGFTSNKNRNPDLFNKFDGHFCSFIEKKAYSTKRLHPLASLASIRPSTSK